MKNFGLLLTFIFAFSLNGLSQNFLGASLEELSVAYENKTTHRFLFTKNISNNEFIVNYEEVNNPKRSVSHFMRNNKCYMTTFNYPIDELGMLIKIFNNDPGYTYVGKDEKENMQWVTSKQFKVVLVVNENKDGFMVAVIK